MISGFDWGSSKGLRFLYSKLRHHVYACERLPARNAEQSPNPYIPSSFINLTTGDSAVNRFLAWLNSDTHLQKRLPDNSGVLRSWLYVITCLQNRAYKPLFPPSSLLFLSTLIIGILPNTSRPTVVISGIIADGNCIPANAIKRKSLHPYFKRLFGGR